MSEDLKEIVTKTLAERLSSPILGYVGLSWLTNNWSNIAFLALSKQTIEQRIASIEAQPYLTIQFVIIPIAIGLALAIVAPYVQYYIGKLHGFALDWTALVINKRKLNSIENESKEEMYKARLSKAKDLENAKLQARIALIEDRTTKIKINISNLHSTAKSLREAEEALKFGNQLLKNEYTKHIDNLINIYELYSNSNNSPLQNEEMVADLRDFLIEMDTDFAILNQLPENTSTKKL